MVPPASQTAENEIKNFLNTVTPARRQAAGRVLWRFFADVTGYVPRMWGASIIGYGSYHYTYDSGRSGTYLATGFSPRKSAISIYIMPGYTDFGPILARLGKHKIGKSCLYVNQLEDIDMDVLKELVQAGLADLATRWPVSPD